MVKHKYTYKMWISHTKLHIMLLQFFVLNFLAVQVFGDDTKGYHSSIGIPAAEKRLRMEKKAIERDLHSRIAGGSPVPDYSNYPWLAGIIIFLPNNTNSLCGATLLTADRLLTAAHCWVDPEQNASHLQVVLGTPYLFCSRLYCAGVRVNTSNVMVHPGWDLCNITTVDTAVIYLPYRINFTYKIYPIALPLNNIMDSFEGYKAIVAGYGRIDGKKYNSHENPITNYAMVNVISNEECVSRFQNKDIWERHICTSGDGAVGICQGDSGGPLVTFIDGQYTLIGISALGHYKGCNLSYPSVYTRITSVIEFIMDNIDVENFI